MSSSRSGMRRKQVRPGWLGWAAVVLWALWLSAAQGRMAASDDWSAWTPDMGAVLFFALTARVEPRTACALALAIACARGAVSVDPFLALLAAYLTLAAVHAAIRSVLALEAPWLRAFLACLGAGAIALWLPAVHLARHSRLPAFSLLPWDGAARAALATLLAAVVVGPVLARLPGTASFRRPA